MWRCRLTLVSSLALAMTACSTVEYSADYDRQARFSGHETYGWLLPTTEEQAALERVNPFLERRLQRAVERELSDRGFARVSDGDPDLWVSAYPIIPRRRADSGGEAPPAYGAGYGRSRVHVSVGFAVGFGAPYGFGYPFIGFGPYWGFGFRYPLGPWWPYYGYPRFGWGPWYGWSPWFGMAYSVPAGYRTLPAAGGSFVPGTIVVDVIDARSDEIIWRGWAEGALQEAPPADRLAEYIDEVVERVMRSFPPPSAA